MMKKSRILSLAMAGALCFSLLAGCGGSGGTASSPAPETTSPETGRTGACRSSWAPLHPPPAWPPLPRATPTTSSC